jgi:16S rRNA (uracil1498-N3)-methyltransferase
MNRFFVSESNIRDGRVLLGPEQAHQVCHVLRLKEQDQIVVLDNLGSEYDVVIQELGRQKVEGQIVTKRVSLGEPDVQVSVYQSLLSRDKFEWVLQKCTEIGVSRLVPVVTRRSIVQKTDRLKPERERRWVRIITEAAEQCGRGKIPRLEQPVKFDGCLCEMKSLDVCLLASTAAPGCSLRQVMTRPVQGEIRSVGIFIGPEGGFHPEELAAAKAAGVHAIGLGRRILRTETAAMVVSALVLHELDQLQ